MMSPRSRWAVDLEMSAGHQPVAWSYLPVELKSPTQNDFGCFEIDGVIHTCKLTKYPKAYMKQKFNDCSPSFFDVVCLLVCSLPTFASFALPTNGTRTIETWSWNCTLSVVVTWIRQTWVSLWIAMGRKHQRELSRHQQYFRKQENAHEKHRIRYIGSLNIPKPTQNPWSM